jgi:hypothetical protein
MADRIIARGGEGIKGEGVIKDLPGGALSIPSFTDPEKTYKVHPATGFCQCKRYQWSGFCEKHVQTARALVKARELRFGSRIAERKILDLARRVYAPVKRGEHPIVSYELFLEVAGYKHAPESFVKAALKRHGRVLYLDERRAA